MSPSHDSARLAQARHPTPWGQQNQGAASAPPYPPSPVSCIPPHSCRHHNTQYHLPHDNGVLVNFTPTKLTLLLVYIHITLPPFFSGVYEHSVNTWLHFLHWLITWYDVSCHVFSLIQLQNCFPPIFPVSMSISSVKVLQHFLPLQISFIMQHIYACN